MKQLSASISIFFIALLLASGCASGDSPVGRQETNPQALRKIDAHAHYRQNNDALIVTLDRWNMGAVLINVASTGSIEEKWDDMIVLQTAHPGYFTLCATFDPFLFNEPDFAERVIAQLDETIEQGAKMVKVWKNIGMELKDESGVYVQIDHPRFQPIWDFLVEEGVPVLAHIAEPRAAWLPLDERSPHYYYYRDHPEYHAFQHPEMPRWETIIEARDRWIAQNPDLVIIGAHLGSMSHDVDEVARRLDAYPNFHVETSARIKDMAAQPSDKVRNFIIKYQDRISYGTDYSDGTVGDQLDSSLLRHWTYFTGSAPFYFGNPETWGVDTHGLDLPSDVRELFYHGNVERLLGL